jgi:murein DD-endopeptidase MepM/ murein hydrolase activator NlpD
MFQELRSAACYCFVVRFAPLALLIAVIAPPPVDAITSSDAHDPASSDPMNPVLEGEPEIVRRELRAGAGGTDRKWVRAVRDLVENRIDVDSLPWEAPLTVWSVDDEVVAFELPALAPAELGTHGRRVDGTLFAARVDVDGAQRWIFDDGSTLDGPMLSRPVRYQAISSKIGIREHPIRKKTKFHAGTDYAAPIGTPIRSIADGVIIRSKKTWSAGNFLVIRHDDGHETKYLHMDQKAKGTNEGVRVRQGEIIGTVGKTGRVTGPHLHFEMRDRWGTPLDPVEIDYPAAATIEDERALRVFALRKELLGLVKADGTRDVLHPLVVAREGVEDHAPLTKERRSFVPCVAPVRGPGARARLTPPPSRRRKRIVTELAVFDEAPAGDDLCERAVRLAAEFPETPRLSNS